MSERRLLSRLAWPVVIETWTILPGPPEVVWDLITDWEHQDDWMLEASDFRVLSPQREGIGVEAEATIGIAGIRTRDPVRVVSWDPPRRLAIEHAGWVTGRGDIHLSALDDETTYLAWREELRNPQFGPLGSVGLTLMRPLMRRIFRRDLRVLQSLVRARGRS